MTAPLVPFRLVDGFYKGIVDLLQNAADCDGRVQFSVEVEPYKTKTPTFNERLQTAICTLLYGHRFINHRLPLVKSFAASIKGTLSARGSDGRVQGSFSLADLLCLPAQDPKAELLELASFFKMIQEVCSTNSSTGITLVAQSGKDAQGSPSCELSLRFQEEEGCDAEVSSSEKVRSAVAASPLLQHFFREVAVSLQKVGRHSWCVMDTDRLYPDFPGSPRMQRLLYTQLLLQKLPSAKTAT